MKVSQFLASLLISFIMVTQVLAQEADTTGVIGFDDVQEEAPQAASNPSWIDTIHLSGRFDIVYETLNPAKNSDIRESRFRNYHKFIFLKVNPGDGISLDAEILDLSYYEIGYKFDSGINLRAGKIWVPFGATPFHHYYGAAQGDPFDGLLLPNVWAEFGTSVDGRLYNGDNMHIDADAYVISGFENTPGEVIDFTRGGADDVFAFGGRAKLGLGSKFSAWGSALYNQFGPDKEGQVFLWGGDIQLDYGLVDVSFLRDLRLRAAFARAEVQDEVLVDPANSKDFWYYRYGDYAELTYKGFETVFPRVRYGTIIDFDDRVSNRDSHNWDVALLTRAGRHLLFLFEYQFNLEEVNEIDNDLFRFQAVFEF